MARITLKDVFLYKHMTFPFAFKAHHILDIIRKQIGGIINYAYLMCFHVSLILLQNQPLD